MCQCQNWKVRRTVTVALKKQTTKPQRCCLWREVLLLFLGCSLFTFVLFGLSSSPWILLLLPNLLSSTETSLPSNRLPFFLFALIEPDQLAKGKLRSGPSEWSETAALFPGRDQRDRVFKARTKTLPFGGFKPHCMGQEWHFRARLFLLSALSGFQVTTSRGFISQSSVEKFLFLVLRSQC